MATIEESVEVDAPVDVVYGQWTQFEEFPRFMKNVKEVRQLDDTRLQWTAEIAGRTHTWEAKILEQEPNRRIVWNSIDGATNRGTVEFTPAPEGGTKVDVTIDYEPDGFVEQFGSLVKADDAMVGTDLNRFKQLVEERGGPTGEWPGEIRAGRVSDGDRPGRPA